MIENEIYQKNNPFWISFNQVFYLSFVLFVFVVEGIQYRICFFVKMAFQQRIK